MAQQGSILVFVVLILAYMRLMDRLDAQYANDNAAENSAHSDEEAGQ
jgi:putative solute:sodium symporter small subunit